MNYQKETLPENAEFSASTPEMTEKTVLKPILAKHMAPRGKYGFLRVSQGTLKFQWEDTGEILDADPEHPIVIFPERFHHVILTGPAVFRVEFYKVPDPIATSPRGVAAERPGESFLPPKQEENRILDSSRILRAFHFRHACKEFEEGKIIPEEDFNCILESARLSPSSFGFEPWHFLVVRDRAFRKELLPFFWGGARQIPSCSHLILTLSKKSFFLRWDSDYIRHIQNDIQHLPEDVVKLYSGYIRTFQEKDFELMESDRALCDWAAHQTYIPLANMMMTAAYLGIDSCPMEGFGKRAVNEFLARKKWMDPEKYSIAHAVAFGYRKKEPREKTRQNLSDIVTVI